MFVMLLQLVRQQEIWPKRQQRNFLKNTLLIQRILIFYCFVRKVLIIICRPQLVYYNID